MAYRLSVYLSVSFLKTELISNTTLFAGHFRQFEQ